MTGIASLLTILAAFSLAAVVYSQLVKWTDRLEAFLPELLLKLPSLPHKEGEDNISFFKLLCGSLLGLLVCVCVLTAFGAGRVGALVALLYIAGAAAAGFVLFYI